MSEQVDASIVQIRLDKAQALVLFEFLARETEADTEEHPLAIVHPAELRVLWAIEGQLEKSLVETFSPHYDELLRLARESILSEG